MQRRIFGIETEYGITCAGEGGTPPPLNAEEAARELFNPLLQTARSTNVFLPNGGRLYLDVGAHPEYATAECDTVWDLLAQVRAGASILSTLATTANQNLSEQDTPGTIHLFGNNQDSQGSSYGCHENYLLRRRRDFREVADALVAFFVTRQIISGAGDIRIAEDGRGHFVISSRADQMHEALSAATTQSRPIINTRDEPLADSGDYRRLHVIVGDSNMAEPTTALKVATADMVLAAVENGARLDDLALADPMKAIREVSADLSGQVKIELADGRRWTAAQIQTEIKNRTLAAIDQENLPDLYKYLIGLWERAIDAVASGDWSEIDKEIDFAIKHKLLLAYRDRSGAEWADPRVQRLALSYHDITAAGLLPKLEQAGVVVRLTNPEQVAAAEALPPQTTRAKLRGETIAAANLARRDLGVDWVNLRLDVEGIAIALQDPFATADPRIDSLVDLLHK